MPTNYPTGLDSLSNPTPTTLRNEPGFSLSGAVATLNDIAEAVEAKLGIGASVPTTAGDVLAVTANGATAYTGRGSPRGLILNGNMDHFQRAEGAARGAPTTFNTDVSFAADRMFVLPAGAAMTHQRSSVVPDLKSTYSLQLTGAAGVTTVDVGQRIRGAVVQTRGRQSLVFSCYLRNETAAAFTPSLRVGTPTALDAYTTLNNRLDQPLASCPAGAWTRLSYVFNPSAYTDIFNGMEVALRIPSGVLVASQVVRVSQFDVRPGAVLLPYDPPDPDDTYHLCQGYYEKSYDVGSGAGLATSTGAWFVLASDNATTKFVVVTVPFRIGKWKTPSVVAWDHAGNANRITTLSTTGVETNNVIPSIGIAGLGTTGFRMLHQGAIAGQSFQWAATAELS